MKVCLYLEFYNFLDGILFKKVGTGLLSSYRSQKAMLTNMKIDFVEHYDDSCDILQINTPWLKSLWLIKKARKRGMKVIIWSHVTAEDIRGVFWFGSLISPFAKRYLTYAYSLADKIASPSVYTKKLLITYGLPEDKIFVQSNGVDRTKMYADISERNAERIRLNITGLTIGTLGLVIPRKGVETFINLSKKFPDYKFFWFGKIYSALLAKPLPKNLPKNIMFPGFVDNIRAGMNALDVFVFPSFEENEGMAILEAAALGLPILLRDIPVYEGWLTHNVNCLKAKDDIEFETYLKKLLQDKELRAKLGTNALKVAENSDINVLGKKMLVLYNELMKGNSKISAKMKI